MKYQVKVPILGFEQTEEVELVKIDDLTATMTDVKNPAISFTLINPYALREYSFDVPTPLQVLLEMNKESKINVYNLIVLQNPSEKSLVNFLAPLVFNEDNATMGQAVLSQKDHPDLCVSEEVSKYIDS
jgi:flagellar assembly factor FliW